jgi:hypothetical protein
MATDSESKLHLDATTDSEACSLRRGGASSVVDARKTGRDRRNLVGLVCGGVRKSRGETRAMKREMELAVMVMKRLAACLAGPVGAPLANMALGRFGDAPATASRRLYIYSIVRIHCLLGFICFIQVVVQGAIRIESEFSLFYCPSDLLLSTSVDYYM